MIVYQATKSEFLQDVYERDIEEVILATYQKQTHSRVSPSEIRSWKESLNYVAKVLRDEEIPDSLGVAVEYRLPQSNKRIDVTVSGFGHSGEKRALILELKQWETADQTQSDGVVKTYVGGAVREVPHPSYQAWSYACILESFNEAVYEDGIKLQPCGYLHNFDKSNSVLEDPFYKPYVDRAPLFFKGEDERQKLRDFIKRYIKSGDTGSILFELDSGRIRPSKALADSLSGLMKGKEEFVLIDEQKIVFETALSNAVNASVERPKVVIVEGGPGTGKTVVAINLLVALINKGQLARYVSKNAAPREVYKVRLTGTVAKSKFDSLFSGSGSYIDSEANDYDVLIVDEAHRLNEKSGLYANLGEHQIKELINAAKTTIFFIDEDQRVTLSDVGSKDEILKFAKQKGAEVVCLELPSQFRCNGSDGYLAWLDNTLQIRQTANTTLTKDEYDFQVFDCPSEMHRKIEELNSNNKARVVAGYCWPWNSKKNSALSDIVIGDYQKQWNLGSDGSLWIISPSSVDQVGCIHTCQGLELDYIGVIIGSDFTVRDGVVVTSPDKRSTQDKSIRGYKKLFKEDPERAKALGDAIVKNTYRTLMTRGMKGCFVYSEDKETREYFNNLMSQR